MRQAVMLALGILIVVTLALSQETSLRIACVGNSITYGYGIAHRDLDSYPAQLQALLGQRFEVRNFGRNGATLLTEGDLPYVQQEEYRQALAFMPDLVFVELGTNDTKPQNRIHLGNFVRDYTALITAFKSLPSNPRVVLLIPPPVFSTDTTGITDVVLRERVTPLLQSTAFATGCEIVNLYSYLLGYSVYFPDQIHPSSIGAGMIAARLYDVVNLRAEGTFDLPAGAGITGSQSSYYGFQCLDFTFEGRSARIVRPKRVAVGHPWIWRARFWGHEPQTEVALLERGFHLVYCDVSELFGNETALGVWDRFYGMLRKSGLAEKAVLEGFSRGGVYVYRWAAANPKYVACVYADAPVLDLKSWPGGKGKGHGNPEEWERFKADFGLKSEAEALAFKGNPIDLAPTIARGGFPMLHVCGDADETVPVEENTGPFEKEILARGGSITVIHKPGVGHHPHSLPNPQPIVDFILRATDCKTNFAELPAPGNEYRPGAGWARGMDWHALFDEMNRMADTLHSTDLLFLGNSITQGIGGRGRSITTGTGDSAFSNAFSGRRWLNFGISGDRTQHVLWRVENGTWADLHPRLIVLTVGVNNFPDDSGEEVARGIAAIVKTILKADARVKILLVGPLPAREKDSPFRRKFETVQTNISRLADGERVFHSRLAYRMLDAGGNLQEGVFASDGIHLTAGGYRLWAGLLASEIDRLKLLP